MKRIKPVENKINNPIFIYIVLYTYAFHLGGLDGYMSHLSCATSEIGVVGGFDVVVRDGLGHVLALGHFV